MSTRDSPPPDREWVRGIVFGDEDAPAPVAVPLPPAAALLPDDLRLVFEGANRYRVPFLAVSILMIAMVAMGIFGDQEVAPTPGQRAAFYALLAGGCGLLGWIGHRLFIHSRREYRMTDEAIILEVEHATDARPWSTHIPWTEIETYTAVNRPDAARLRVRSIRGFRLDLSERPPTLATREFIRRFEARADLYPRAVAPPLTTGNVSGDEDASSGIGCILLIVGGGVFGAVEDLVGLSGGQRVATWVFVVTAVAAWTLWLALDDPDLAHADLTSRRWTARIRRWLRRVFNIPVV